MDVGDAAPAKARSAESIVLASKIGRQDLALQYGGALQNSPSWSLAAAAASDGTATYQIRIFRGEIAA
jgi:hypothetical protein